MGAHARTRVTFILGIPAAFAGGVATVVAAEAARAERKNDRRFMTANYMAGRFGYRPLSDRNFTRSTTRQE